MVGMGSTEYSHHEAASPSIEDFDRSWIRPAILAVTSLKVLGTVLVFDPIGLQSFDYPKSLFSRSMEWILAGLVLLAIFRFGIAVIPRTRLHLAVALYGLAVALSGLAAGNTYISLYGEQGSYLGLTFVGDMIVLYVALAVAVRGPHDWVPVGASVVGSALAASAYAIVQYAGFDPIPWVTDPTIRPFSTLGNPNQLAQFLTIAAGVALGAVFLARTIPIRIGAALCCGLFLGTAGLTGARGGLLGIAMVALTAVVVVRRIHGRHALSRRAFGWGLAAGVLIVVALASPAGQRLAEGSLADRLFQYDVALRAFVDKPVLGYGPDQFQIGFIRNRPPESVAILGVERPIWAHDFVLQALVTTGAVGATALLLLLASGTIGLWMALARAPRIAGPLLLAWIGYWSESLVTVSSASVDWFPWVALGVCAALNGKRVGKADRRPFGALARATLIAAACVGAFTGVAAFRANHDAGFARLSLRAGQSKEAISAADSAVNLDPGRATYWNWLGIANEAAGLTEDARASYAEAVGRADYIATYWANLARARAELAAGSEAMRVGALEAAQRAVELDPYEPLVRRAVADTAFLLGDCDRALSEMLRAYVITRGDQSYIADLDRATACSTDLSAARHALSDALAVTETAPVAAALAVIDVRANDPEEARINAMRALELDPSNATAQMVLDALGP